MVKRIILKSRNLLHRRRNRYIRNVLLALVTLTLLFVFRFSIYTHIVNLSHPYPEWVEIESDYVDVAPFREALIRKLKKKRLVPYGIHSFQGSLHCIHASKEGDSYRLIFRVMMPYGTVVTGPPVLYRVSGKDLKSLTFEIEVERYGRDLPNWKPLDLYISTVE